MKKSLLAFIIAGLFMSPAMAKKPEWAGKGKPSQEQLEAHKDEMQAKGGDDVDEAMEERNDELKDDQEVEKDKAQKKEKKAKKAKKSKQKKQGKKAKKAKSSDELAAVKEQSESMTEEVK